MWGPSPGGGGGGSLALFPLNICLCSLVECSVLSLVLKSPYGERSIKGPPSTDRHFEPWNSQSWNSSNQIANNIRVVTRYIFSNWSLMKNTADPDPTRYDSRSRVCDPWSRPFSGLWPRYDPAILQWLGVYGILRSIYLANSFERLLCYPAAWICLRLPLNVLFFAHAIQTHNSFYDTHVRLWIWAANCFVS